MQTTLQPELPIFAPRADDPNIAFLCDVLDGGEWMTAREICDEIERRTGVRWTDRHVRALANVADICGGQRGYKRLDKMTREEYGHWRNWMSSQAAEMQRRILRCDRSFYARIPVSTGCGILEPTTPNTA